MSRAMRFRSRVALVASLSSLVFFGCPPQQQESPVVMTVTPPSVELSQGEHVALTVTLKKGTETLSASGTTWSSSATSIASVAGNADGSATVTGVSPGTATLTAHNGSSSATVQVVVQSPIVTRIELTPAGASLAKGTTLQLVATAVFTNGATQDYSSLVTWSSADEAKLTVSSAGVATGVAEGSSTVTANLDGLTATLDVTVTGATLSSLALTPAAPSLAAGTTLQLTATGTFSDGTTQDLTSQVTWMAPGSNVLTLSTEGLVTGVVPGSASVSASLSGVTGSLTVTVTAATLDGIIVTPAMPSIAKGTSVQLVATGHFTNDSTQDLTSQVTWSSSNANVVVSTTGEVTGALVGAGDVTATLNTISGSVTITVTAAELVSLDITGFTGAAQLPAGLTKQLTATGVFTDSSSQDLTAQVTWSSDAPTIAMPSNGAGSEGLLTALSTGTAVISATMSGITGSLSVEVTGAQLVAVQVTAPLSTLPLGVTQNYAATGVYSDGSTPDITAQVTWASSDAAVASISNAAGSEGLLTTAGQGSATISATLDGVTGTTSLTVGAAALVRVDVTGTPLSLAKGRTTQLSASAVYTSGSPVDVTTQATWTTSDAGVAMVDNAGLVTAVEVGAADIAATFGGKTGTVSVSVTPKELLVLFVSPSSGVSVPVGLTQDFTVDGEYSDGSHADLTSQVTWTTGAAATATISNAAGSHGRLTAVAEGTTTVQAALDGVTSSTVSVTVSAPVLLSIAVTPASPSLAKGRTQQFTATGTYSDGSTPNLTSLVTWASDDASVTVSNAAGSKGLATAANVGSANLTAVLSSVPGVTGNATMTVTAAVLASITVTPAPVTVSQGGSLQLTATGSMTDATPVTLTSTATWTVTDPAIATVSASGLLQGVAQGTTTVRASKDGVDSALVTVTVTLSLDAVLVTAVDGGALSVPRGRSLELKATARYSDNSMVDVTASWLSDDTSVAIVSDGLVFGANVGTANISATYSGVTGSAAVQVLPAVVETLSLSDLTVPRGATTAITLTGALSDGSPVPASSVTWSSSDASVTVDASGNVHVLNGATIGATATITATRDGVTATGTVTVGAPELIALAINTSLSGALPSGRTTPLTATGTFSDGTSGTVTSGLTWVSSQPAVVSVTATAGGADAKALAASGSADITVSSGAVTSATLTVTAGAAVVDSVSVIAATIARGTTQQLSANVTWSDGTSGVVGAGASWSSDTPANISVTAGGIAATPGAVGSSATVTATFDGVSGTGTVTVGAPNLVSLTLSPSSASLPKGLTQALTATASYSDGSTTPLPALTWASSAPTVASVDASGVVKAEAASGTASITATSGSVTSNAVTVTAQAATIVSLTASAPSQVKQNVVGRATATANYSDGTTADVTSLVTWSSAGAASVSNVIGATGTIIPSAIGTASISATASGFTADAGQVNVVQVVATAQDAGMPGHLVISQVYGSNNNAYRDDYVELFNPTESALSLNGLSLQYASTSGTSWSARALPNSSVAAGGYFLVRLTSNGTTGIALVPDFTTATNLDISGSNGKVALVSGVGTLPTASCPTTGVIDFVGFGTANCAEGTAAPAGSTTAAVFRNSSGCRDTNNNSSDFTAIAANPRNSSTARIACEYSATESDRAEEADFCNLQFPSAMTLDAGTFGDNVYSQLYEAGSTEAAGAPAGVTVQIGYGASSSNPAAGSWLWWPATYNVQVGNNDEFQGAFVVPATGTYSYTARISLDGGAWTYCDLNGAGSNSGLTFETSQLGTLTVP